MGGTMQLITKLTALGVAGGTAALVLAGVPGLAVIRDFQRRALPLFIATRASRP